MPSRAVFSKVVAQTPVLLVPAGHHGCLIMNTASGNLLLNSNPATWGVPFPTNTGFADNESDDAVYGYYASSSGTVAGFYIP